RSLVVVEAVAVVEAEAGPGTGHMGGIDILGVVVGVAGVLEVAEDSHMEDTDILPEVVVPEEVPLDSLAPLEEVWVFVWVSLAWVFVVLVPPLVPEAPLALPLDPLEQAW